ncbi:transcription termination factor Rho [Loigolactobacillus coryniformis subsp. coryniformis]|jgi:transcription termination factor Rho|uniref:Transcription termination factor Rho n=2 Tax=Loigolactobacillus coryniformis TaxID=1610 RepID=J2ZTQ6_9LACO|nr:transcription termination factor Rho [Loigolactobacillus coryniformis]RRG05599.1 MAG: transcription termination factor Rho [Lactobacillus sp.]EJN56346.1 Transcription termination factor Rho (ATP-dependent helicase Rho) [Loigolactobacillus coryniformis subsp. coryniformis CECT 5711]MBW4801652.1 transcription termination factor Rho [Loigolactobacillus coryniformis subsp. torquens]MBW4804352.1 transcription termination factor Rho [Loigolactobacillus coryniformis subsp. torquens]QEA52147.1 tran
MSDFLTMGELENQTLKEIYKYARDFKIPYYSQMNKKELSLAVLRAQAKKQGFVSMEGVLEIVSNDGFGFLRPINYGPSQEDIYISASQIRRFGLRTGDKVVGRARPPKPSERYYGLMHVDTVNGKDPEEAKQRPHFPALTALYPERQLHLETTEQQLATRLIDAFAPVGFGQRGLIVAPPKAGKTSLLKAIAAGIAKNYPDAYLIVLLIDERPEEVTDIERSVKGDVVYSTFDQQPANHTRVSELVLERAERLVEDKQDVIILLDSITRLTRAYNLTTPSSGRTLSGGLDPAAFYRPKRFFGAARNIEEGGSLTILATALVDTGSRMDDVIYEEFKGTGNLELHLSRELSERRIFPALDIKQSGTRKEELLLAKNDLEAIWKIRRSMTGDALDYTEQLLRFMQRTSDNRAFFENLNKLEFKQHRPRNYHR